MDAHQTRSRLTPKTNVEVVVDIVPKEEDDWHIVSANSWWRTSFLAVSWAFEQPPPTPKLSVDAGVSVDEISRSRSILPIAKPPHYHCGLYNEQQLDCLHQDAQQEERDEEDEGEDNALKTPHSIKWQMCSNKSLNIAGVDDTESMLTLNEDLVGVQGACEVMKNYESAIGFECQSPSWREDTPANKNEPILSIESTQTEVELDKGRQERWRDFVEDLMDGKTLKALLQEAVVKAETQKARSATTITRTFSRKRNAKPLSGTGADYFSRLVPSPTKTFRLNPTASSFVPITSPSSTFSSLPSLSFGTSTSSITTDKNAFSFPTLTSAFPPIGAVARKDHAHSHRQDPAYLTSTPTRSRTSSSTSSSGPNSDNNDFLPPFLQESTNNTSQRRRPARLSRTRAIVDQLRSRNIIGNVGGGVVQSLPTSQGSSPVIPDSRLNNGYLSARMAVSENGALSGTRRTSLISSTASSSEEDLNGVTIPASGTTHPIVTTEGGWTLTFPTTNSTPICGPVDPETKRNRSKELFLALRRRTDSLSSSNANSTNGSTVSLPLPSTLSGSMGVRSRLNTGLSTSMGMGGGTPSVWSEPGTRLVESPEPQEIEEEEEDMELESDDVNENEERGGEEVYEVDTVTWNQDRQNHTRTWHTHSQHHHRHTGNTSTTSNSSSNVNVEGSPSYSSPSPSPTLTPPPITPTHIYPQQYTNTNTHMYAGTHMHTYPSVPTSATHYTHSHHTHSHPLHTHHHHTHTYTHTQHSNYGHAQNHKPNGPVPGQGTGYLPNSNSNSGSMPYTFLPLPLPLMTGIPMPMNVGGMNGMNMVPVPMSMSMSVPPTIPVPVPVPVPLRVQGIEYSTLMHLRIMQQMRVMRNSMGFNGVVDLGLGGLGCGGGDLRSGGGGASTRV